MLVTTTVVIYFIDYNTFIHVCSRYKLVIVGSLGSTDKDAALGAVVPLLRCNPSTLEPVCSFCHQGSPVLSVVFLPNNLSLLVSSDHNIKERFLSLKSRRRFQEKSGKIVVDWTMNLPFLPVSTIFLQPPRCHPRGTSGPQPASSPVHSKYLGARSAASVTRVPRYYP